MLCDLPWSGWHGCYVILRVKPLDLGLVRAHFIIVFYDLVSSALLCWDEVVLSEII